MNIRIGRLSHESAVSYFTAGWIVTSIISCAYFSFFAFPSVLSTEVFDDVDFHFLSINPGGDYGDGDWYLPNRNPWRQKYLSEANERDFLFISLCDIIPKHQRLNCDNEKNWKRIAIEELGCDRLENCLIESMDVTAEDREDFLTGLRTVDGRAVSDIEDPPFSFENPNSWGPLAPFLMFLLTLFFALKSGRLVGEFLFEPYSS